MWVKDFDTDEKIILMTRSQRGLFLDAMNYAWTNDGLPENEGSVGRALRMNAREFKQDWPVVSKCFLVTELDGRRRNPRQEEERTAAKKKSQSNARPGNKNASRTEREENATANLSRSNGDSNASQRALTRAESDSEFINASSVIEINNFDAEACFYELWNAYPSKARTKEPLSQQYYLQEVHSKETHDFIMECIRLKWDVSEKWHKGFVLALPEWISQRCWNETPESFEEAEERRRKQEGGKKDTAADRLRKAAHGGK